MLISSYNYTNFQKRFQKKRQNCLLI